MITRALLLVLCLASSVSAQPSLGEATGDIYSDGVAGGQSIAGDANAPILRFISRGSQTSFTTQLDMSGMTIGAGAYVHIIDMTGTLTVTGAPSSVATLTSFRDNPTIQNDAGNARTLTGVASFASHLVIDSNNAVLTLNDGVFGAPAAAGFTANAAFKRSSGSSSQTATQYTAFAALADTGSHNVNTGWTVTDWRGFSMANPDVSGGTITNLTAIDLASLTAGGTNISLRSAGAATMRHAGKVRIGDTSAPSSGALDVTTSATTGALVTIDDTGTLAGTTQGLSIFSGGLTMGSGALVNAISSAGAITINNSPNVLFTAFIFSEGNTYQNDGTARTLTGIGSFAAAPTYKAVTNALTLNNGLTGYPATAGFTVQPTWSRSGTPTQTDQQFAGFVTLAGTVGAGWTITDYRGFHFKAPTVSGAVTNMYGLDIEAPNGSTNISARIAATAGNEVLELTSVATNDDPTEQTFQCRVATTDATVTDCKTIAVTSTKVRTMEATVVAHCTGGASCTANNGGSWTIIGTCKNNAGTTGAVAGSPDVIATAEDVVGWDATIDCDDTGDTIRLRVTGAATTNITWHATIRSMEVGT